MAITPDSVFSAANKKKLLEGEEEVDAPVDGGFSVAPLSLATTAPALDGSFSLATGQATQAPVGIAPTAEAPATLGAPFNPAPFSSVPLSLATGQATQAPLSNFAAPPPTKSVAELLAAAPAAPSGLAFGKTFREASDDRAAQFFAEHAGGGGGLRTGGLRTGTQVSDGGGAVDEDRRAVALMRAQEKHQYKLAKQHDRTATRAAFGLGGGSMEAYAQAAANQRTDKTAEISRLKGLQESKGGINAEDRDLANRTKSRNDDDEAAQTLQADKRRAKQRQQVLSGNTRL